MFNVCEYFGDFTFIQNCVKNRTSLCAVFCGCVEVEVGSKKVCFKGDSSTSNTPIWVIEDGAESPLKGSKNGVKIIEIGSEMSELKIEHVGVQGSSHLISADVSHFSQQSVIKISWFKHSHGGLFL